MSKVTFVETPPSSNANNVPEKKKEETRTNMQTKSSSHSRKSHGEKHMSDRRNWYLYQLFARQEYARCRSGIEAQLRETGGVCEYALYLKALLKRNEGKLKESLLLLQASVLVNPLSIANRKQLGRALLLVGQFREAIEAFEAANVRLLVLSAPEDWEAYYCIGVCQTSLQEYERAEEAFLHSIKVQKNDLSYIALAEVYSKMNEIDKEESTLKKALAANPENPTVLCMLGQYYLHKRHNSAQAFDCFGRCLGIDSTNATAIASVALLLQASKDYDSALSKYRLAVSKRPHCPYIWNNIGACFYGKRNYYAAISCLRKAQFLRPFEWTIHYNSGLVQLSLGRYVGALNSFSSAINLQPSNCKEPFLYMNIGICYSLMNDLNSSRAAFKAAIHLAQQQKKEQKSSSSGHSSSFSRTMTIQVKLHLSQVNDVILLHQMGMLSESRKAFDVFMNSWRELQHEDISKRYPPQIVLIIAQLDNLFQ